MVAFFNARLTHVKVRRWAYPRGNEVAGEKSAARLGSGSGEPPVPENDSVTASAGSVSIPEVLWNRTEDTVVGLRCSTLAAFNRYRVLYAARYGRNVEPAVLMDQILFEYMMSDPLFNPPVRLRRGRKRLVRASEIVRPGSGQAKRGRRSGAGSQGET